MHLCLRVPRVAVVVASDVVARVAVLVVPIRVLALDAVAGNSRKSLVLAVNERDASGRPFCILRMLIVRFICERKP